MQRLSKSFVYTAIYVLALGFPAALLAQDKPQEDARTVTAGNGATATLSSAVNVASSELPESPGASWLSARDASLQQDSSAQPAASPGNSSAAAAQEQAQEPQRPVGTAAAEAPSVNGVTAAEPAGVAIAPAKQRRVRTVVLRVGAIVGASVAVGAVIALTAGTSSKPPGAH